MVLAAACALTWQLPGAARADCALAGAAHCNGVPCGAEIRPEGDIIYNDDYEVLKVCRESTWQALGPIGSGPAAPCVSNGLVGHWKLDENNGTTAADSSGNGNDGTLVDMNPGTDWVSGKIGGGLHLDGTNDFVNIGDLGIFTETTIAFWMDMSNSHVWPVATEFAQGLIMDWNKYRYRGFGVDKEKTFTFNGSWNHVALTVDDSNIRFYVDVINIHTVSKNSGSDSFDAVVLGQRGDDTEWFEGTLDDVRIYNRALTAQEVSDLYNGGAGCQ